MTVLRFEAFGTPAPQGSKRYVGNGVMIESSKAVKPWREAVKYAALDAMSGYDVRSVMQGPVSVEVTFYLPRPKSHYRTGANAHLLRDKAPAFPATRPDIDKLLRSTLDALTSAGVYGDDGQVAALWAAKVYGAPARANIVVTSTAPPTKETR